MLLVICYNQSLCQSHCHSDHSTGQTMRLSIQFRAMPNQHIATARPRPSHANSQHCQCKANPNPMPNHNIANVRPLPSLSCTSMHTQPHAQNASPQQWGRWQRLGLDKSEVSPPVPPAPTAPPVTCVHTKVPQALFWRQHCTSTWWSNT